MRIAIPKGPFSRGVVHQVFMIRMAEECLRRGGFREWLEAGERVLPPNLFFVFNDMVCEWMEANVHMAQQRFVNGPGVEVVGGAGVKAADSSSSDSSSSSSHSSEEVVDKQPEHASNEASKQSEQAGKEASEQPEQAGKEAAGEQHQQAGEEEEEASEQPKQAGDCNPRTQRRCELQKSSCPRMCSG